MRTLIIILGAVLGCYCSAGILSETLWPNSETADRALCRLLLCINPPLIERGRQQLMGAGKENAEKAAAIFKSALQRDPQNPYRWAELGDAYLDAGQTTNARYCYSRLPVLAPLSGQWIYPDEIHRTLWNPTLREKILQIIPLPFGLPRV
jgi:cytochrome c-type biogenesis protein CcmH/NrfG